MHWWFINIEPVADSTISHAQMKLIEDSSLVSMHITNLLACRNPDSASTHLGANLNSEITHTHTQIGKHGNKQSAKRIFFYNMRAKTRSWNVASLDIIWGRVHSSRVGE